MSYKSTYTGAEIDANLALAATTDAALTAHKSDASAHSALFANKAPLSHAHTKSQITDFTHTHAASDITSGTLAIARGGTGGATAATARTALGAAAALTVVTDTSSTTKTIATLADNTEYRLGTLTALTVSAMPSGYFNATIKFTAGTSITVTLTGASWLGGEAPTFAAGKVYEISIADGRACAGEW